MNHRHLVPLFVTLALVTTLVSPTAAPADPGPITLTPISTGFNTPIGIDHHDPTNKVVLSVNYASGQPYNFELVSADGERTQFSDISGLTDEVKIATVRTSDCQGGFAAGELFTGSGADGVIVRISADGTAVQNPWVNLGSGTGLLRGSLFQDRYCSFGGDLIAVTTGGYVFRVTSDGVATQLAALGTHLEGVTTVPADPAKYGPWAGRILAGAEGQGCIYAVDSSGNAQCHGLGISPEDLDVIPANENFFGVNFGSGTLQGAEAEQFTEMVGDVLVTQESGVLFRVHWNADLATFEVEVLASTTQWEHVTFSPAGIKEIPPTNAPPTAGAGGPYTVAEGASVALDGSGSSDPDGDALSYAWDLDGDATFETPGVAPVFSAAGRDGPSSVAVSVQTCDPEALCATDVAQVAVTNVAPTPDAGADRSVARNQPLALAATFTDPAAALDQPYAYAWDVAGDPSSGSVDYGAGITRTASFATEGTYVLTLSVTDDDGGEGRDTVVVSVANRPPVAVDDTAATVEGQALVIPSTTLVANDTDADGDALSVVAVGATPDTHGSVASNDHLVTYTPEAGYVGPASFTYTVADGHGGTAMATVAVEVTPVVHALSGGAFGYRLQASLLGFPLSSGPVPEVVLPPTGGGPFTAAAAAASTPLRLGTLAVSTEGVASGADAHVASDAQVSTVQARGRLAGGLRLEVAHSHCRTTPAGSTGATTIARLVIGSTTYLNLTPEPGTRLVVPGVGTLVLNEQVRDDGPGRSAITVNAVHLHLLSSPLASSDVVLAQSRCGMARQG